MNSVSSVLKPKVRFFLLSYLAYFKVVFNLVSIEYSTLIVYQIIVYFIFNYCNKITVKNKIAQNSL